MMKIINETLIFPILALCLTIALAVRAKPNLVDRRTGYSALAPAGWAENADFSGGSAAQERCCPALTCRNAGSRFWTKKGHCRCSG